MSGDFWVGVTATATVLLALIGVIQFLRSRSNLLVEIKPYPWALPATAQQYLKSLDQLIAPMSGAVPKLDHEAIDKLHGLVKLFRTYYGDMGDIDAFWQIQIMNRGHERADGVELHVPGAVQIVVKRGGTSNAVEGERAGIGDVRPNEDVQALAWGRQMFFKNPSIIQSRGRGTIRMHGVVGPVWVFAADLWRFAKWPLLLLGVFLGAVLAQLLIHTSGK